MDLPNFMQKSSDNLSRTYHAPGTRTGTLTIFEWFGYTGSSVNLNRRLSDEIQPEGQSGFASLYRRVASQLRGTTVAFREARKRRAYSFVLPEFLGAATSRRGARGDG